MVSQPSKDKVEARKRLFATRFKTEMCRTYSAEGACPYEGRCMFAHGAGDLRTEAMNERDGLTSALAVREWLDVISGANSSVTSTQHGHSDGGDSSSSSGDEYIPRSPPMMNLRTAAVPTTLTPTPTASSSNTSTAKPTASWRHEPYSWVMPFVVSRPHY